MLVGDQAHFLERPGNDRELRIEQPPECDRRQHRRHDERDQHHGADDRLERQPLVEQQREIKPDREFDGAGDDRVEQRVEHREPERRVVPQPFVVFEPDEYAGAADARVGERQPDAEAERIGQKQDQERRRRQHEPERQPVAVGLQPLPRGGLAERRGLVGVDFRASRPLHGHVRLHRMSRRSNRRDGRGKPARRWSVRLSDRSASTAARRSRSRPSRPRGRCSSWRTCRRTTKSAIAVAAFSPTEPSPPAVSVRLATSRNGVAFGSAVHTGFLS